MEYRWVIRFGCNVYTAAGVVSGRRRRGSSASVARFEINKGHAVTVHRQLTRIPNASLMASAASLLAVSVM